MDQLTFSWTYTTTVVPSYSAAQGRRQMSGSGQALGRELGQESTRNETVSNRQRKERIRLTREPQLTVK